MSKTVLVITTDGVLLASKGERSDGQMLLAIWKGQESHSPPSPPPIISQPQMPVEPRKRSPGLEGKEKVNAATFNSEVFIVSV